MDIFYARNICPSLDIKIILRTLPALVVQFYEIVQPVSRPGIPPIPPVKT